MALSKITSNSFSTSENTNIDNGTLFVNVTSNRVGINTSSTGTAALTVGNSVDGTGNIKLTVANSNGKNRIFSLYDGAPVYELNSSGGAAILFERISGSDEIAFETHYVGNYHRENMRITKEGYIKSPYQPKFFAYRSGTGNQTTAEIIPFDTTDVNIGNHFSTSTYRFTAPVAGTYYFATEGMNHQSASSVGYSLIKLMLNGAQYGYFHIVNSHPASCSKDYIITLAAGDYVQMQGYNYHWNGNAYRYPSFSGYLMG